MRIFVFSMLLLSQLFAHSVREVHEDEADADYTHYGIFADAMYRSDDLYPHGVEGSAGYENHGVPDKVQLNHIGVYLEGLYASRWRYGAEVNRHTDSPATFDGLVEKLYAGYGNEDGGIVAGREANNISFVREHPWGYGFAQMPLAVDSFFDGTYYGDGLFLDYRFDALKLAFDVTKDRFTKTLRSTFRAVYDADPFRVIAYAQLRERSEVRVNYAASTHTHTHGSGCNNLTENERCFERSNNVFGLGGEAHYDALRLQGEYIFLDTQGDVYNNSYKVESHNRIHSLYAQGIYAFSALELGLRTEWFIFSNRYSGDGASKIAEDMATDHADDAQYLNTAMASYRFGHSHKVIVQGENSQEGWAWRASYILTLDDPL
jgi:hypothetical protein